MSTTDAIHKNYIAAASLPEPVLFHPLKHHLGFIKAFIHNQSQLPGAAVSAALVSIGTSQLDFYTGMLTPQQVAEEVILYLTQHSLLHPKAYHNYLTEADRHYRTITLTDKADWVLRWGVVAGRYVHLHPARYAAQTIRVKATSLKTAIAATIAARRTGTLAMDLTLVNQVRREWLQLPPLTVLPPYEGAGKLIRLLKDV